MTEAIDDLLSKEGIGQTVSDFKSAKEEFEKQNMLINDKKDEINSKLAIEMKKILSGMGIVKNWSFIIRDGITFKYKSKSITLNPNLEDSIWEISPGSQSQGDVKFYKHIKDLNGCKLSDWKNLLTKIADAFRDNYKSLQDDDYLARKMAKNENAQQEMGDQDDE